MTHCPHCGEKLEPEVKRPDGCICDNNEWDDPYTLPPVCDKFEADHVGMNCTRCEHDYECHAEAHSNAKSQATDAALSRQVACTDGLGVAVPPAPTIDEEIGNG